MAVQIQQNLYKGPGLHISPDLTTNAQPVANHAPDPDKAQYPKYVYHKEQGPKLVASKEEEESLGEGFEETPQTETKAPKPYGTEDSDLSDRSREDLVLYGNNVYGLQLSGAMSREDLVKAIKTAAQGKHDNDKASAEKQQEENEERSE